MDLLELVAYLTSLFGEEKIAEETEWAVTVPSDTRVSTIGFATNLTPETVEQAADAKVDLLITHHDAWDFVYGMTEIVMFTLRASGFFTPFSMQNLRAST